MGGDREFGRDELAALLAEQSAARELVRGAAVAAPAGLRARVEAMRRPAPRRRGLLAGGAAVAALAVLAALLLVVLPGGSAIGPTVAEAAELAFREPTLPAPGVRADEPALLEAEVEGVAFPEWAAEFGWEASGERTDELDGRRTRTVFYDKEGKRIAYTIVAGASLEPPSTDPVTVEGVPLRDVAVTGGNSVAWERRDHTCVLGGAGVPPSTLRKLAAWRGSGAVEF